MIQGEVSIRLTGLTRFRKAITSGNSDLALRVLKVWARIYQGYVLTRFNTFSRGGGDWAPLSPATLAKRRKGSGKNPAAILADNGDLRTALLPGINPGWQQTTGPWRLTLGFGGPAAHSGGGQATIADIANFHHAGSGNLPQRQIIVQPPGDVLAQMGSAAATILGGQAKDDIEGSP